VFDCAPVSRDYAYQRQSRLIDSWRPAMSHHRSEDRARRRLDVTSPMTSRPPTMTSRPRRETDSQDYETIDELRRGVVTYCALTTSGDTKRMNGADGHHRYHSNHDGHYETVVVQDDSGGRRLRFASDSELSGGERIAGERTRGRGKRRFGHGLFVKSSDDHSSRLHRSRSSSAVRLQESTTPPPSC